MTDYLKKLLQKASCYRDDEIKLHEIANKLTGCQSPDGGLACLEFWENIGKFANVVLPIALRYAPKLEILRSYVSFHDRIKSDPKIHAMFKGKLVEYYVAAEEMTDDVIRALMILSYVDVGDIWLEALYDRGLYEEVYVLCVGLHDKYFQFNDTSKLIYDTILTMRISKLDLSKMWRYLYELDLKDLLTLEYKDT